MHRPPARELPRTRERDKDTWEQLHILDSTQNLPIKSFNIRIFINFGRTIHINLKKSAYKDTWEQLYKSDSIKFFDEDNLLIKFKKLSLKVEIEELSLKS